MDSPIEAQSQPAAEPAPPRPSWRRSKTRMWATVGVVAALVAGGAVIAGFVLGGSGGDNGDEGAAKVVERYLTALSRGDAAAALQTGPPPASTTFLTNDALAAQQSVARINKVKTGLVTRTGDNQAEVIASYTLAGRDEADGIDVRKVTGKWQLVSTTATVDLSQVRGIPGLTLFGKPVSGSVAEVFPGPLRWGSSNPDVELSAGGGEYPTLVVARVAARLNAVLSAAGKQKVLGAVRPKMAACERATSVHPNTRCRQMIYDPHAIAGTARWRIASDLGKALEFGGWSGSVAPTLTLSVTARIDWDVTYRATDHGKRVVRQASDETVVFAKIDLSKSPPACTLA
jgi:hypothetical protein